MSNRLSVPPPGGVKRTTGESGEVAIHSAHSHSADAVGDGGGVSERVDAPAAVGAGVVPEVDRVDVGDADHRG